MILKSYELQKNSPKLLNYFFFLMYGENFGLKKDIRELIRAKVKQKCENVESLSFYEDEILGNVESFYNNIYSGSLFSATKMITIYEGTDKIINIINDKFDQFPEDVFLIIFGGILDKKSKLRNFFEKEKKTICIPCYLDNEKDLEIIARSELKKNNVILSRESINLLIEKSNFDRGNLKNEIEKIKCYSLNKKNIELDEIKFLTNFSGEYKSDFLINECLCGNINQYKKILTELYTTAINQILLFRLLANKIQRLLKIKIQESNLNNLDSAMNLAKPPIFWKEKPLVKKQLMIWELRDLERLIVDINNTELLCKKNPQLSKVIFFEFFSKICKKANSYS
jgi:DNA polymerase-3 subunit delta